MLNWFKNRRKETTASVSDTIATVAVQIDDLHQFRAAAADVASNLDTDAIETLSRCFHTPSSAPDGFGPEERGLGGWLSAWQFAIFEIYYNFGEAALPLLREVAYGEYDWTQGNAIEVLCRLAADGVSRDVIIDELKREFPNLRYEAQLYAVKPMLAQVETNPNLADILDELSEIEEFRETVAELTEEHVDDDSENITNNNLHGTVTSVEVRSEQKWNRNVIGAITVSGLNYFSFDKDGGNACLGVTDQTRLLQLSDGTLQSIQLTEISVNDRVALGYYDMTEQTDPVTVYPESITRL